MSKEDYVVQELEDYQLRETAGVLKRAFHDDPLLMWMLKGDKKRLTRNGSGVFEGFITCYDHDAVYVVMPSEKESIVASAMLVKSMKKSFKNTTGDYRFMTRALPLFGISNFFRFGGDYSEPRLEF